MNRSQAVAAGVWYNPTPEQRRELKLRAQAFRSKQRRRVLQTMQLSLDHAEFKRLLGRLQQGILLDEAHVPLGKRFDPADIARIFSVPRNALFPAAPVPVRVTRAEVRTTFDRIVHGPTIKELMVIRNLLDEVQQ